MKLSFVERRELAPTIWEYTFQSERPLDFVAGQYVSINVPGVVGDSRGSARVYTLTSQPGDELITFILKLPEPHSPHKEALTRLQPGDPASCQDAMGDLILPKDPNLPLVFIAGGIGIASYVSMLQELLAKREERQIFFYYALRDKREQLYRELFNSYPLAWSALTIAPNRLTAQQVLDTSPPDSFYYLSGSQRFVEGLRAQFEQLGVPRNQIVFDYYDGYAEL
ncbi:MAG TPA: FAD-dependent oxidoreductase [Candidatus Microsaccharimonas sp.]|nr:FAD-dependent oxidoreductase [Candidatus Microsaccharimonas sp.]